MYMYKKNRIVHVLQQPVVYMHVRIEGRRLLVHLPLLYSTVYVL